MINIPIMFSQVKLDGFEETAQLGPLFAILVSIVIVLASTIVILFRQNESKEKKLEKVNTDHTNKIDSIRKEHAETIAKLSKEHLDKLEQIRLQMIEKEDQRNRESREGEKETLQVLNGVSSVLELGEKMKVADTKQILEKIKDLKNILEK